MAELVRRQGQYAGFGGTDDYKKTLRALLGPKIYLQSRVEAKVSSALDTGLADGSVDVLMDRGAHAYVLFASIKGFEKPTPAMIAGRMNQLVKEYQRVLKTGGKAIVFFNPEVFKSFDFRKMFTRAFRLKGMQVEEVQINETPFVVNGKKLSSRHPYPNGIVVQKLKN